MDDINTPAAEVASTAPSAEALSAIDEIAAQFAVDVAAEEAPLETDAPAEETVDEGEVPAVEAAAEEAPVDEASAEEEAAPEDRGIARLVEREVAIRTLEDQVSAREKAVTTAEARLKDLEAKAASYEGDFHDQLRLNPTEALKAAGHDPEQVVRLYLAEKFQREGKPVPDKLQREIDRAQDAQERNRFRNEQLNFQRAQQAQQFVAGIEAGARTYITAGISKDAPTVAAVAAKHPDRVYREIMDEIAQDAHARSGKEPNGAVLTYDEAAKKVEARWADYRALLGLPVPGPDASTANSGTATTTPASKVAPKGASATAPKPPAKPLAAKKKPLTEDELIAEGIAAGVAEHKRQQTAKQPRS